jgi:hypothetical protein
MAPITKLLRKIETFDWTKECQHAWDIIWQQYMDPPILIALIWDLDFHVHTDAWNLAIGVRSKPNMKVRSTYYICFFPIKQCGV